MRKLKQLDDAGSLEDLKVPPGNRLELLKADRAGRYSIRINDRYRVCFRWEAGRAYEVEIVDDTQEGDMTPRKQQVWGWNIHPGEILREEFLKPMGISVYRLAKEIRLSRSRLNDIVREKRAISADTAVRLGRYFGTTPQFWMNMQASYELRQAENALGREINGIIPVARKAA